MLYFIRELVHSNIMHERELTLTSHENPFVIVSMSHVCHGFINKTLVLSNHIQKSKKKSGVIGNVLLAPRKFDAVINILFQNGRIGGCDN